LPKNIINYLISRIKLYKNNLIFNNEKIMYNIKFNFIVIYYFLQHLHKYHLFPINFYYSYYVKHVNYFSSHFNNVTTKITFKFIIQVFFHDFSFQCHCLSLLYQFLIVKKYFIFLIINIWVCLWVVYNICKKLLQRLINKIIQQIIQQPDLYS